MVCFTLDQPAAMIRTTASLTVCLLLAGCSLFMAEPHATASEPPPIRTDAEVYEADVDDQSVRFELALAYTNASGETAYLHGCRGPNPPSIQRRRAGDWVTVYEPVVLMCLSPPTPVAPGETFEYPLEVDAAWPGQNVYPTWDADAVEGTYRLAWSVEELGEERVLYSNPFALVVRNQD